MSKVIRLTESDLHNMIKEAINELDWRTYASAAKKANDKGEDRSMNFADAATDSFNKEFGYKEKVGNDLDNNDDIYHEVDGKIYRNGTANSSIGEYEPLHYSKLCDKTDFGCDGSRKGVILNKNHQKPFSDEIKTKYKNARNAMHDFYKSDNPHLNENKVIKLTESDLHNMIKNTITELKNNK
jgi:hypothetical protein